MSVDKLIKALEGDREFGDVWVDDDKAKDIVVALHRLERLEKAGQAMRGYFNGVENSATEAWDAATKEDV